MPDSNLNGSFNQQSNPFSQGGADTVSGVERVHKKKGKKVAIISGVTVAAIAGGGIAAYNLSPFVKNQVKLRTMKADAYYAWVGDENLQEFAKEASESYGEVLKSYEGGVKGSAALTYTASEEVKDMLRGEIDDDDEEAGVARDIIDNFEKFTLGVDYSSRQGASQFSFFTKLNDDDLVSLDCVVDVMNYDLFFRVPQLTEQYVNISGKDYIEDLDSDLAEFREIYEDIIQNPSDYLSASDLEREIIRYGSVWFDSVGDVSLEKSEEVDVLDITAKYTVATVELDEAHLLKLAESFLSELKGDDIIKNIVVDKLEVMDEDEYESAIDEYINEISDSEASDEVLVVVKTYIDPKGKIRGLSITDKDSDNGFKAILGKHSDKIRGELKVFEDGEDIFYGKLEADEEKKETYTGSLEFTAYDDEEDYTVSIDFDEIKETNEKKHYIDGDITINIPEIDPINIYFDSDGSSQDISYDILIHEKDYGRITLSYSSDDDGNITIPDKSDAFIVDPENIENIDFRDYITEKDAEKFCKDILVKIGLSSDDAEKYAAEAVEELYDEIDDAADKIEDRIEDNDYKYYEF